jgi:hypothetical protein
MDGVRQGFNFQIFGFGSRQDHRKRQLLNLFSVIFLETTPVIFQIDSGSFQPFIIFYYRIDEK